MEPKQDLSINLEQDKLSWYRLKTPTETVFELQGGMSVEIRLMSYS